MNSLKHKLNLLLLATVLTFGLTLLFTSVGSPVYAASACSSSQVPMTSDLSNTPGGDGPAVCCPKGTPAGNATACIINKYVTPMVQLLSAVVGLAVTTSIIIGAIQYSASAGDPGKAAAAKDRIRNALIALIAFIFMFGLLQWLVPGGVI